MIVIWKTLAITNNLSNRLRYSFFLLRYVSMLRLKMLQVCGMDVMK